MDKLLEGCTLCNRLTYLVLLLFSFSVMSDSSASPGIVAHQAPLSMRFPRQEYWSGLPFPPPGDLPDPRSEPKSSALTDRFFFYR